MDIVCEGSKELLNQYGVIAVNPEKYPDVNNEAAIRLSSGSKYKKIGEHMNK